MTHTCPVCGYTGLNEEPYTERGGPSYEICRSCGFEFGVTDDDEEYTFEVWRKRWVDAGMKWRGSSMGPPDGWDPQAQLDALLRS